MSQLGVDVGSSQEFNSDTLSQAGVMSNMVLGEN